VDKSENNDNGGKINEEGKFFDENSLDGLENNLKLIVSRYSSLTTGQLATLVYSMICLIFNKF